MEGAPEPAAARALAVTFVQKPQDGSADAALDVALMPSYVYYSGAGSRLPQERVAARVAVCPAVAGRAQGIVQSPSCRCQCE